MAEQKKGDGHVNQAFSSEEEQNNIHINSMHRSNSHKNIPNPFPNGDVQKSGLTKEEINRDILRKRPPKLQMEGTENMSRRSSFVKSPGSYSSKGSTFGRRLSTFAAHKYSQTFTEQQKAQLAKFSSVSYQPTHSHLYTNWLKSLPHIRFDWDRWLLLIISGICIGLYAVLLKQFLQLFDKLKWSKAKDLAQENDTLTDTFLVVWGIATGYVILASVLVVFIHPPAVGSGVPEIISYLNGIVVHGVFSFKNLIVKFASLVLGVSSGLPLGTQGPIIALGAIIGRGIGQFKSKTFGVKPKWFERFRNAEDRRAFTTAGVAAGVSAAFNAPIGGLLFAMEDLTSFWSKSLCWQTFFCSGIAALVASMFNTAFNAFEYQGQFGLLSLSIKEPLQMHVLSLIPAIILGVTGGLLGALFTRLNTWIVGTRKKLLAKIKHPKIRDVVRVFEPVVLVLVMVSFAVYYPNVIGCTEGEKYANETAKLEECGWKSSVTREVYNCPPVNETEDYINYNDMATLIQGSGTSILKKLTSRGTYRYFSYATLGSMFPVWYFMTIYTCGSALAGGIFLPNLISGALYGRLLGLGMVDLYHILNEDYKWSIPLGDKTWAWVDPGVIAVIGAGSLLGGVTRLTLAVTVIVIEMSHDLDLTVPTLIAIWIAKIIADLLSKPLYKYQLDGKALPFLDGNPVVPVEGHIINLELFKARHIMSSPVLMIKSTESVHVLSSILLNTTHSGFPVVKYDQETRTELAVGLITRLELNIILCHEDVYNEEKPGAVVSPNVKFEEISVDYISDQSAAHERIKMYAKFPLYNSIFVNLDRFINRSVTKIDQDFSLKRTYQHFQSMGLRHVLITNDRNHVAGMITRKDLLTFNLERKLTQVREEEYFEGDTTSNYDVLIKSQSMRSSWLKHDSIREENEADDRWKSKPSDNNNNNNRGSNLSSRPNSNGINSYSNPVDTTTL